MVFSSIQARMASMNYNVKLILLWSFAETASASLRAGDVMSAFIYLSTGSNSSVGFIQGINGIMQMVISLPAGFLTDRYRRDTMLRVAALVGCAAAGTLAVTLIWQLPAAALFVSMGLLGAYRGSNNPPLESLWADSVPRGASSLYTAKWIVQNLSSILGPLISIVFFVWLGNTWEVQECRVVLLAGLSLIVVPLTLMCFFSDDRSLGARSTAHSEQVERWQDAESAVRVKLLDGREQHHIRTDGGGDTAKAHVAPQQQQLTAPAADAHLHHPRAGGAGNAAEQQDPVPKAAETGVSRRSAGQTGSHQIKAWQRRCCCSCCPGAQHSLMIPILISISDFIGSLAAGMTVKFFAIFFLSDLSLKPTYISGLGAAGPVCISLASITSQKLSKRVGRVQLSLVTRLLDIGLLVAMALLPATASAQSRATMITLHLFRTSMANCTRPLMRSLMMDNVPKRHRGKFNGIEGVRTFSWSGSAAAGGVLISYFGFQGAFLITAALKLCGWLALLPLLGTVDEGLSCKLCGRHKANADVLHEPLLAQEYTATDSAEVSRGPTT